MLINYNTVIKMGILLFEYWVKYILFDNISRDNSFEEIGWR